MLEQLDSTFPILSCLYFPPARGRVLWLFDDEDMVRTSALTIASWSWPLRIRAHTIHSGFGRHAVFRTRAMDSRVGDQLPPRGGRDQRPLRWTHSILAVLVIIYSWDTVRHQVKLYMMALLALETTTMGVFVSLDLILFFVFWELMLIPSYFLIKLWGGEQSGITPH